MRPQISAENTGIHHKHYRSWITKRFDFLARTASRGLKKKGPGVVMVFERIYPLEDFIDDIEPGQDVEYLTTSEIKPWLGAGGVDDWKKQNKQKLPVYIDVKRVVGKYDPEKEIVVSIFDQAGYDDTYKVTLSGVPATQ